MDVVDEKIEDKSTVRTSASRGKEELFAVYERLNGSFQDLTFRHYAGSTVTSASVNDEQLKKINDPLDASLDFAQGLEAIKPTLSTVVEPEEPAMLTNQERLRGSSTNHKGDDDSMLSSATQVRGSISCDDSTLSYNLSKSSKIKDPASLIERSKQQGGGAPHTNYCATCSSYAFCLRTRCLVCGKCYCLRCVKNGMGSMPEGRKCKGCLGKGISKRYLSKAGKGFFVMLSKVIKKEEIKWARKITKRGSGETREASPTRSYANSPKSHSSKHMHYSKHVASTTHLTSPKRTSISPKVSRHVHHLSSEAPTTFPIILRTPPCSPRKSSSYSSTTTPPLSPNKSSHCLSLDALHPYII